MAKKLLDTSPGKTSIPVVPSPMQRVSEASLQRSGEVRSRFLNFKSNIRHEVGVLRPFTLRLCCVVVPPSSRLHS